MDTGTHAERHEATLLGQLPHLEAGRCVTQMEGVESPPHSHSQSSPLTLSRAQALGLHPHLTPSCPRPHRLIPATPRHLTPQGTWSVMPTPTQRLFPVGSSPCLASRSSAVPPSTSCVSLQCSLLVGGSRVGGAKAGTSAWVPRGWSSDPFPGLRRHSVRYRQQRWMDRQNTLWQDTQECSTGIFWIK